MKLLEFATKPTKRLPTEIVRSQQACTTLFMEAGAWCWVGQGRFKAIGRSLEEIGRGRNADRLGRDILG